MSNTVNREWLLARTVELLQQCVARRDELSVSAFGARQPHGLWCDLTAAIDALESLKRGLESGALPPPLSRSSGLFERYVLDAGARQMSQELRAQVEEIERLCLTPDLVAPQ